MDNSIFSRCVEIVALSVHFDPKLYFDLHINSVVKSCYPVGVASPLSGASAGNG